MSIIMSAEDPARNSHTQHRSDAQFEPEIKALLDHIAVELAAEYVRLMEAAAQADDPSPVQSD
jgi:hypothetical protein